MNISLIKKKKHFRFCMFFCTLMFVVMPLMGFQLYQREDEIYSDVYTIFVSGKDVYAAGSICTDGTSATNVPTLWKNGVGQKIGNMGNFNRATSVFVLGDDVYVAISETDSITDNQYDGNLNDIDLEIDELVEDIELSVYGEEFENSYNPKAILWKNGERHILWKGSANTVYVSDEDVYVVGEKDEQPVLWKNGNLQVLASSGSAESVVVHGKDVYVAGYLGSIFNGEAVVWKNGEMTSLGRGIAHSIFITDNADVFVSGTVNMNAAALWKNGELWWSENTYNSNAYSMTMTKDGKIIVSGNAWGTSGWNAVVWINGSYFEIDDKMRYQAMTVVADNDAVYVGGDGKGRLWPVWQFDWKESFNINQLSRVPKTHSEQPEFKRCPIGHYYQGDGACPYCRY